MSPGHVFDLSLIGTIQKGRTEAMSTLQAQLQLDVDSPANLVSMQQHIEHAIDRFQLIVIPESATVYRVSCSSNILSCQLCCLPVL